MKKVQVAINVIGLTAPEVIIKSTFYAGNITANPSVLADCAIVGTRITTAVGVLQLAIVDAADKAVSKLAIVQDKLALLIQLLYLLGATVEDVAGNDESIVHLIGMDLKKQGIKTTPDFAVKQGTHSGTVNIKVKAHKNTMYKWQYCLNPESTNVWTDAGMSRGCKTTVTGLTAGIYYWFRVVLMDDAGEHPQTAFSFAVN